MASLRTIALCWLCLIVAGCSSYEYRHAIQWDSRLQIGNAGVSQVKIRAAQSRVFDTSDKGRAIDAIVATFQDLGFQVDVLDGPLGIVSGKKFLNEGAPGTIQDPFYYLYDDESLLIFTRTYRTWGPFRHRSDMLRLTMTVRARNEAQLVIRASAQYFLQPVENPAPYQLLFRALEQALFLESQAAS